MKIRPDDWLKLQKDIQRVQAHETKRASEGQPRHDTSPADSNNASLVERSNLGKAHTRDRFLLRYLLIAVGITLVLGALVFGGAALWRASEEGVRLAPHQLAPRNLARSLTSAGPTETSNPHSTTTLVKQGSLFQLPKSISDEPTAQMLLGEWHFDTYNTIYQPDGTFQDVVRPGYPRTHNPEGGTWRIVEGTRLVRTYSDDQSTQEWQISSMRISQVEFKTEGGSPIVFHRVGQPKVADPAKLEDAVKQRLGSIAGSYADHKLWNLTSCPEIVLSRQLVSYGVVADCAGQQYAQVRDALSRKDWIALVRAARAVSTNTSQVDADETLSSTEQIDQMRQHLAQYFPVFIRLRAKSTISGANLQFFVLEGPDAEEGTKYQPDFFGNEWIRLPDEPGYSHAFPLGTKQVMILHTDESTAERSASELRQLVDRLDLDRNTETARIQERKRLGLVTDAQANDQLAALAKRYRSSIRRLADQY